MDVAALIRNGVATANSLLATAQGTCTLAAWTGQDGKGKATYATAVPFQAVVDYTRRQRWLDGRQVNVVATLTVLAPIAANGATGRREPVDTRDRIVLPDGTTGPILTTPNAVLDPAQGRPFIHEILIGEPNTR